MKDLHKDPTAVPEGGAPKDYQPPMADISWVKRKYLDIVYDTKSPVQKLDIYLPEEGEGPFPVLVHYHGGGFAFGDKRDDHMNAYLEGVRRGIAVASVEYRMSGEAIFPAAVLDARQSIRFLRLHGAEYHIDPDKIIALGGSSGGNLAASLAMNVPNGGFPGENPVAILPAEPVVALGIDQFGPIDFLSMETQAVEAGLWEEGHDDSHSPESRYLGVAVSKAPERLVQAANPVTYATPAMAPLLIQHGTADHLIPYAQSVNFAKELEAKGLGNKVQLVLLEGADHEDKMFFEKENMDVVFDFIRNNL